MIDIEPKLLKPERVIVLYRIYNGTGEIFDGSPIKELFEHIAALTLIVKRMEEADLKRIDHD